MNSKERYHEIFNGMADEVNHLVSAHIQAEKMFIESQLADGETYEQMHRYLSGELTKAICHMQQLKTA